MKRYFPFFVAALATLIGVVSVVAALTSESAWGIPLGLVMHGVAVWLCLVAARMRRKGTLSDAELDVVLGAALFIPGLGPACAWTLPQETFDDAVQNAHEVIERYTSHVKPVVPDYERSLFTGDRDVDLARKLDAESFREVLHHGDTDQKRSALFRLAELGATHHIAMIRDCLTDDDQEVRLYAYGELERLTRGYEEVIAKARRAVAEAGMDYEARLGLAQAYYDLAAGGVLDKTTAGFYFRAAAKEAQTASLVAPDELAPIVMEARSLASLGDLDAAEKCIHGVPEEASGEPEVSLVRAEIAFRRRDFEAARMEAGVLLLSETDLPGWLAAICSTPEGKVLADFDAILASIEEEATE